MSKGKGKDLEVRTSLVLFKRIKNEKKKTNEPFLFIYFEPFFFFFFFIG